MSRLFAPSDWVRIEPLTGLCVCVCLCLCARARARTVYKAVRAQTLVTWPSAAVIWPARGAGPRRKLDLWFEPVSSREHARTVPSVASGWFRLHDAVLRAAAVFARCAAARLLGSVRPGRGDPSAGYDVQAQLPAVVRVPASRTGEVFPLLVRKCGGRMVSRWVCVCPLWFVLTPTGRVSACPHPWRGRALQHNRFLHFLLKFCSETSPRTNCNN